MTEITLHLDVGRPDTIPVEMPGATTSKYALKRCLEKAGISPEESWLFALAVGDVTKVIPGDQPVADYDGQTVYISSRR